MPSSSTDRKTSTCPSCPTGRMEEGTTSLTFEDRDHSLGSAHPTPVVVVLGIPAEVCDVCGEALVASETAEEVNEMVREARYGWTRFSNRLNVAGVTVGGEPGEEGGVIRIDFDSTEMPVSRKYVG